MSTRPTLALATLASGLALAVSLLGGPAVADPEPADPDAPGAIPSRDTPSRDWQSRGVPDPFASGPDVPRTSTERFYAGERYTGMFADPSVVRAGKRFVAVATNHDGLNLNLMTSPDLRSWFPRPGLPDHRRWTDWRGYNDAMPVRPAWAARIDKGERKDGFSLWAPSVARIGGRWVAAFSAATRLETATRVRRSCIGLATSRSSIGPFTPTSSRPLVCYPPSPRGVIDPDLLRLPDGRAFLTWKREGIPGRADSEPALMVQQLSQDGTGFRSGSQRRELLELVRGTWKGGVIENPSMIAHRGRHYLFYSAHDWFTARYAVGYAECETPLGPCVDRTHQRPLLASDARRKGPGGGDAFVDRAGRLRLAYAAWDRGRVGPTGTHARRLHVATLQRRAGRLRVVARG